MVLPFAVTTTKAAATARRPTENSARHLTLLLLLLQPLRTATILHNTTFIFSTNLHFGTNQLPSHSSSSQITRLVAVARPSPRHPRLPPAAAAAGTPLLPHPGLSQECPRSQQPCGDLDALTPPTHYSSQERFELDVPVLNTHETNSLQ